MSSVLDWVKSHVFIVVFGLIIIAAPVSMLVVSGCMNASVRERVEERSGLKNKLDQISRTSVNLTGPDGQMQTSQVLVNEQLLQAYEQRVKKEKADADEVVALAISHNRGDHTVLMPQLLPEAPASLLSVLRLDFFDRIQEAYVELHGEVRGGTPPAVDAIREEVSRVRVQFLDSILKDSDDELTEEEQAELTERLAGQRLRRYEDAASNIGIYVGLDDLDRPVWDQANLPALPELFEWHWRYWMQSDILRALAQANASYNSVIQAPVKRVLWLNIGADGAAMGSDDDGGGASFGAGANRNRSSSGGAGGSASSAPINFATAVPEDYQQSFTGRTTNALYDVRYVDLHLIVDTARLPAVLDSLAKQNFITVIGLEMNTVDPHGDLAQGFLYGSGTVSEVRLVLETIWLRRWMQEYMPSALKAAKGIPMNETPAAPAG